jgi:hypothetical protein
MQEVLSSMNEREPATSEMDAIVTGATTSSHPSATEDVEINRSGSGGTGGPSVDDQEVKEPGEGPDRDSGARQSPVRGGS